MVLGGVVIIGAFISFDTLSVHRYTEYQLKQRKQKTTRIIVVAAVMMLLSAPGAFISITYKNVLMYQGITSENADKIMDSSTRILELAEKYVEGKVK